MTSEKWVRQLSDFKGACSPELVTEEDLVCVVNSVTNVPASGSGHCLLSGGNSWAQGIRSREGHWWHTLGNSRTSPLSHPGTVSQQGLPQLRMTLPFPQHLLPPLTPKWLFFPLIIFLPYSPVTQLFIFKKVLKMYYSWSENPRMSRRLTESFDWPSGDPKVGDWWNSYGFKQQVSFNNTAATSHGPYRPTHSLAFTSPLQQCEGQDIWLTLPQVTLLCCSLCSDKDMVSKTGAKTIAL